jgi:hypothetical protein
MKSDKRKTRRVFEGKTEEEKSAPKKKLFFLFLRLMSVGEMAVYELKCEMKCD